jgi:hypothetical protein
VSGPSGRPGKYSNIYTDVFEAIFDNYYSTWGLVDDAHTRESPI